MVGLNRFGFFPFNQRETESAVKLLDWMQGIEEIEVICLGEVCIITLNNLPGDGKGNTFLNFHGNIAMVVGLGSIWYDHPGKKNHLEELQSGFKLYPSIEVFRSIMYVD